jgi:hypothetical protein
MVAELLEKPVKSKGHSDRECSENKEPDESTGQRRSKKQLNFEEHRSSGIWKRVTQSHAVSASVLLKLATQIQKSLLTKHLIINGDIRAGAKG